jgi:hypothetical protein
MYWKVRVYGEIGGWKNLNSQIHIRKSPGEIDRDIRHLVIDKIDI